MNHKQLISMCSIFLASLSASAQMPAPLLTESTPSGKRVEVGSGSESKKQIESLLQCKAGTKFTAQDVESQFRLIGLVKGQDGLFFPSMNGSAVSLWDSEVVAALVIDSEGEKKISVYLKNPTVKQLAKKFGVTKIDEEANTDEPSFFKQTSKKTTLLLGAADELAVGKGDKTIKYTSSIQCQLSNYLLNP